MSATITALESVLGYTFKNSVLLQAALTHTSALKPTEGSPMERLEFLGDRVVNLCIARLLFETFPNEPEGHLSKRHAALVRAETLAEIARGLNLGRYITLGRSEKLDRGAEKINILSDALEALLAAVYCDGGMHEADKIIEHLWQPLLNSAVVPQDAKSALQEWLQARGQALPVYSVLSQTGNAQAQTFTVQVQAGEYGTTTGVGNSKRAAEQQAAQALLERLKKENT